MSQFQLSSLWMGKERRLATLIIFFSFLKMFQPIEAYFVPYLVREKHFTNFEVSNKVLPLLAYTSLFFTLLAAPACDTFSYWTVIQIGNFAKLIYFLILRFGRTLLLMQIMQLAVGVVMASTLVFSSYIFLLVSTNEFQALTSASQASSLVALFLSSELGQLLVSKNVSYATLADISLISAIISCLASFILPKDPPSKRRKRLNVVNIFSDYKEIWYVVKETWQAKNLQLLSIWWAAAIGGFALILNYGLSLFEGISSTSKYNGHVVAAATAFGCLAALCAMYIAKVASKTGGILYIIGSGVIGVFCFLMGTYKSLWIAYPLYVMILCIVKLLVCLLYAQCGSILENEQYILMFSFNTLLELLFETLLQVAIEWMKLYVFSQYIALAIYFFCITAIFSLLCGLYFWRTGTIVLSPICNEKTRPASITNILHSENEPLIQNQALA